MVAFLTRIFLILRARFKSRERLEVENTVLRQQVIVLSCKARTGVQPPYLEVACCNPNSWFMCVARPRAVAPSQAKGLRVRKS